MESENNINNNIEVVELVEFMETPKKEKKKPELTEEEKERKRIRQLGYQKKYYKKNAEKLKQYEREYYKTHKEELDEKHYIYYEKNKNKIYENLNKKFMCPICGTKLSNRHKVIHERSRKHLTALYNNNDFNKIENVFD